MVQRLFRKEVGPSGPKREALQETRKCSQCRSTKPVAKFHKNKARRGGYQAYCKACIKENGAKRWRATERYGLTGEQILQKLEDQDHRCAICGVHKDDAPNVGQTRSRIGLVVDHNHDTGEFRGLLCVTCNRFLGFMGDCPERIRKAAEYLLK